MNRSFICALVLLCTLQLLAGQELAPSHVQSDPLHTADVDHPCVTPEGYLEIEQEISRNRELLGLTDKPLSPQMTTLLEWPLRTATGFSDCGYYYISAFVDMNTASGSIGDWNCGNRTYDGHRGIDIVPWPFIWDKMDNDLVEVIAAAPGIIIAKVDGNPDRVCNGIGGGSSSNNYITIQHADGSTALYIHMKTGSLTSKLVGQSVAAGEYLGIVGSAGQSTGVHLHFEVRSDGTFPNYIDPFYGSCNTGIGASWWTSQKPYTEPELLKISIHSQWPYMASCPNTTDTLYESNSFSASVGASATFYACTKHVLTGDTWSFRILDSGSSVVDSWNYTSLSNRNTSTLGWNRTLPSAPGLYTFEGTFLGQTCATTFEITTPTDLGQLVDPVEFTVYPNPSNGQFIVSYNTDNALDQQYQFTLINIHGKEIRSYPLKTSDSEINPGVPAGMYHYVVKDQGRIVSHGNILIE